MDNTKWIFPYTKHFFEHEMRRGTKDGKVKRIRLHDLRNSHASLLIELGFSHLAIADRLGHEKVEITLDTYSHLFPHKRDKVTEMLQDCSSSITKRKEPDFLEFTRLSGSRYFIQTQS